MLKNLWSSLNVEFLASKALRNPMIASMNALHRLLGSATQTAYGRFYGLKPGMSIDDFRKAVPICTYADYKPWIVRIKSGESNVLWPGRPSAYVTTSGTSSTEKLIPVTSDFIRDFHSVSLLTYHRILFRTPDLLLGKILVLGGPSEEMRFGDIPVGSISGVLYNHFPEILNSRLALPPEVHNIASYEEKLYTITRLALEKSIRGIITIIPGSLLILFDALNDMANDLIQEISEGSFRRLPTAPDGLEDLIRSRLNPNPKRARKLRKILHQDGELLPRRIWPVRALCTYLKEGYPLQWEAIRRAYGDLTVIDPGLVASEGRVSVGLIPGKKYHTVLPLYSFIEFLPIGLSLKKSNLSTVLPHELKEGKHYTPIISCANGLLRYYIGDEIRVVHKEKGIPLIEYEGRLDHTASVAGEKVSDVHIRKVITRLQQDGYPINGNWAVGLDLSKSKPRYILAWETNQHPSNFELPFDSLLKEINVSYRRKRDQLLLLSGIAKSVQPGRLPVRNKKPHWIGQAKQQYFFIEESNFIDSL